MNYRAKEKGAISYGSVEVAEVVFSELPSVWSEESNRLFPSTYPFPDFSESGEISFLFSKEGETRVVSDPEISQGEGIIEQSGYIATLKKDPQGSLSGSENFILEVSGPAGRAAERRQKFNFHRRYRSQ